MSGKSVNPFLFWDRPEAVCFLDIETTGLSRDRDRIFCLGLGSLEKEKKVAYHAYWADQPDASLRERALLDLLPEHWADCPLVSYHGAAFDLPFLAAAYRRWGRPLPTPIHLDLRLFRDQRRRLLGLTRAKRSELEASIGFERKNRLTGKGLSESARFLANEEIRRLVLAHNREDVEGLAALFAALQPLHDRLRFISAAPFLCPPDAKENLLALDQWTQTTHQGQAHFYLRHPVPMAGFFESDFGRLTWSGDELTLELSLIHGQWDGRPLSVAAAPAPIENQAPYALRPPLFVVSDADRDYGNHLIALVHQLIQRAAEKNIT